MALYSPPVTGASASSGPDRSQPTEELTAALWTLWPPPLPPEGPEGPLPVGASPSPAASTGPSMTGGGIVSAGGSPCPLAAAGRGEGGGQWRGLSGNTGARREAATAVGVKRGASPSPGGHLRLLSEGCPSVCLSLLLRLGRPSGPPSPQRHALHETVRRSPGDAASVWARLQVHRRGSRPCSTAGPEDRARSLTRPGGSNLPASAGRMHGKREQSRVL